MIWPISIHLVARGGLGLKLASLEGAIVKKVMGNFQFLLLPSILPYSLEFLVKAIFFSRIHFV